jgi:hypothetical protein
VDPILKKPITKKGWWKKVLSSNPSPSKKKKKENERIEDSTKPLPCEL